MVIRGGTSKGAYFLGEDLPSDPEQRADLLRRIMGSPDPRQIDGIGGAHPLTSKVAVVTRSDHDGVDIDYLFLQVGIDDEVVTDRQNCGNLLAGVGPFALARGLVDAEGDATTVRIRMVNTDSTATVTFPLDDGALATTGTTRIAGVPGTAARIHILFTDSAGSTCGALLPTGNVLDVIDGVPVTCVDHGMPTVVVRAPDLGVTGHESCAQLEADRGLRTRLESLRLAAGDLMGLGDVAAVTVPKVTMIARPQADGAVSTRTFIPHRCHEAIGVLGAVSVATVVQLPGSVAAGVAHPSDGSVTLEHPTGTFEATVTMRTGGDGLPIVHEAGIVRTARILMDGIVFPRPGVDEPDAAP